MIQARISVFRAWGLVFLMLALSKAGSAQLVLYDNFNSNHIDPGKWLGTPWDPDQREVVRQVVGEHGERRLHLSQTAYSATTDDTGTSGNIFGLQFPVPSAITEISFNVVVNRAVVVGCNSNPAGEIVTDAEFRGSFFNVEASPTNSDGDVTALISVGRSATDRALSVVGFYAVGSSPPLDFRVLGSVQPGTTNRLRIKWDRVNHRFVFQLNNGTAVVSPYTVSDSTPPFFPYKSINLARVVPHCTTTPRPFASSDAFFSNVYVNP